MATLVVHSREDIARALNADASAALTTTPDAACYHGSSIMQIWQEEAGHTRLLIGCGQDAATAYDALCMGLRDVYVQAPKPMAAKLRAIADAQGARLHEDYPRDAVDMRATGWEKQTGN